MQLFPSLSPQAAWLYVVAEGDGYGRRYPPSTRSIVTVYTLFDAIRGVIINDLDLRSISE